jgi:hypothetical protein
VKVATAVTYGNVVITNNAPTMYLWTYRETGGVAPTVKGDGVSFSGPEIEINHSSAIDVYIWANTNTGEVEVWL